jgi:hypothetical protein
MKEVKSFPPNIYNSAPVNKTIANDLIRTLLRIRRSWTVRRCIIGTEKA